MTAYSYITALASFCSFHLLDKNYYMLHHKINSVFDSVQCRAKSYIKPPQITLPKTKYHKSSLTSSYWDTPWFSEVCSLPCCNKSENITLFNYRCVSDGLWPKDIDISLVHSNGNEWTRAKRDNANVILSQIPKERN